ncbi:MULTISPECIES: DUF1488 family protein [Vibrio]|uniref:DUF1488 family protein n=2 Tax=Vibrio TaxID=662 RepID=A0A7X4LLF0_9VIBR|nr:MULTISPECIES: DUF1488 domain-containing protein [Vibrio]MBF9001090.1 DUF1488 domain-containing protein [Vibrio nitrifigilis]MZI93792.1 DUF1488 family protein [Vibrio eleionomae]
MNQSILFTDIQHWDEARQSVGFTAQQSGALIECWIDKGGLEALSGMVITSGQQALQVFSSLRFDIEELAEELIEDDRYNEAGEIEVKISLA